MYDFHCTLLVNDVGGMTVLSIMYGSFSKWHYLKCFWLYGSCWSVVFCIYATIKAHIALILDYIFDVFYFPEDWRPSRRLKRGTI